MPAAKKVESTALASNTRFYAKVMEVPKEAQKSFNNGKFSGTDINPMWRIQMLTELFGPAGFGWWTQNVRYEFTESPETQETHVFCELELIVKDPETGEISQPIYGIGGNKYISQGKYGPSASDEAKKMAYTDAMSIACKALGFGHNVWYANDKTKYTIDDIGAAAKPAKETKEPVNETVKEPAKEPAKETVKDEKPTEEVQSKHTPDTATVIDEIQTLLNDIGKSMDREAKIKFANDTILPIIGSNNYKKCTDITKLIALRDKLSA